MNVIIIGAGIMGTTFATLAKELAPELDITILERLDGPGPGIPGCSITQVPGTRRTVS